MDQHKTPPEALTYESYLKIKELLDLQTPLAQPESHDEMLFIISHQVFELWFRLILHELERIVRLIKADEPREADRLLRRVTDTVRLFIPKLSVLETMIPSDFIKFRDNLMPASGFQSRQFREIEFICGARDIRYIEMFAGTPATRERLQARMDEPSLWDHFLGMLEGRGFDVADEESQETAVARIYGDPKQLDLRLLSEAMIEYDEMFSLWREHHVRMAQRMIGSKPGTGQTLVEAAFGTGPLGTMGVEYLARTVSKRFFPVLWAARTRM